MPFFDISLETANKFYAWGWRGSIIGAVITAISVIILMLGTRIRDQDSESQMSAARSAAATANENAAKANERTATLEIAATQAQKDLEAERIERLKLEAQLAPRRLTLAQQQAITMACNQFAGRRVAVTTYSLDAEGAILGKQIIKALQAAGINVNDNTASLMPLGGFSLGVHVTGSDQALVAALSAVLVSAGHLMVAPPNIPQPSGPTMSTGTQSDHVAATILVGIKPLSN